MALTLDDLDRRLAARATAGAEASYTASLLARGTPHCARKLGEEAVETVVAALSGSKEELRGEAADLIYHLLVLLRSAGLPLGEVMEELQTRTARSGHEEKAARPGEGGK